jgi:hypothetical protein
MTRALVLLMSSPVPAVAVGCGSRRSAQRRSKDEATRILPGRRVPHRPFRLGAAFTERILPRPPKARSQHFGHRMAAFRVRLGRSG